MSIGQRLSDVYFLTNKDTTDVAPVTNGNGGWSICYHNESALGVEYTVQCTNNQTPLTKLFSIRSNNGNSVELREVQITGYGKLSFLFISFVYPCQLCNWLLVMTWLY